MEAPKFRSARDVNLAKKTKIIMELGGMDVVLGMNWLSSLGEAKANFRNLELSWGPQREKRVLRGDPSLCESQVS